MLGGVVLGLAVLAVGLMVLAWPEQPDARHPSPDGRLTVVLSSDRAFGQVETLRVVAEPGTARERMVFTQRGDVPLRFVRWRDAGSAELARPGGRPLLLVCGREGCVLDEAGR